MNHRLNRLFNPASGRYLGVAVDHGLFGGPSFLTGIADMPDWWPRAKAGTQMRVESGGSRSSAVALTVTAE